MKKTSILFAVFLFLFSSFTYASHLMGGDIRVEWVRTVPTDYVYKITLSLYRDVNGIPITNPELVTIIPVNPSGPSMQVQVDTSGNYNPALIPFFPYGVQPAIFTSAPVHLSPGEYEIVYYSCCRNAAIANASAPSTHGMAVHTRIKTSLQGSSSSTRNSSPYCMVMPLSYFPLSQSATYNPMPYDVDGDSLAWSSITPVDSYSTGTTTVFYGIPSFTVPPSTSTGPFTMNPITGEITWSPNSIGNFINAFQIDEYRAGVKIGSLTREMQYVVVTAAATDTLGLTPTSAFSINPNPNYNFVYYTPGQQLTFNINGVCGNPATNLTLAATGSVFNVSTPPTFSSTGTHSAIQGTLTWTPPAGLTKDEIVVFRLHGGMFSKDFTLLLRNSAGQPSEVASTQANANLQVFPNPVNDELNINGLQTGSVISIFDIAGREVYKRVVSTVPVQINTSTLVKGSYLLQVLNADGNKVVRYLAK